MTRERLAALREVLSRRFVWDGDGQLVDHGRGGTVNDRVRAAHRRLTRGWPTLPETTGPDDLIRQGERT